MLQTLWKSTVTKPRIAYLNSCFISCPTTSDKTESKGAGGSLNAEIVTWVLLVWKDHNTTNLRIMFMLRIKSLVSMAGLWTRQGAQLLWGQIPPGTQRMLMFQNASLLGKTLKETMTTKIIKLVLALLEGTHVFLISMYTNHQKLQFTCYIDIFPSIMPNNELLHFVSQYFGNLFFFGPSAVSSEVIFHRFNSDLSVHSMISWYFHIL